MPKTLCVWCRRFTERCAVIRFWARFSRPMSPIGRITKPRLRVFGAMRFWGTVVIPATRCKPICRRETSRRIILCHGWRFLTGSCTVNWRQRQRVLGRHWHTVSGMDCALDYWFNRAGSGLCRIWARDQAGLRLIPMRRPTRSGRGRSPWACMKPARLAWIWAGIGATLGPD
jgi:hypothetical protein